MTCSLSDGSVLEDVVLLTGDASITVALPHNSSWIDILGMVGPKCGVLHVDISPSPPGDISRSFWSPSTNRPWYSLDSFMRLALHPHRQYNVTLSTDAATAGEGVYLRYIDIIPFDQHA